MGDDHGTPEKHTPTTAAKGTGSSQVLWSSVATATSNRDIALQTSPFPVSSASNFGANPKKEDIFSVLKRVLKTRKRYSAFSPIPFPLFAEDNLDSSSGVFLQEDEMIRLGKNPDVQMYLVQTGKPQGLIDENEQSDHSPGPETCSTDLEAFLQFHSREKYKMSEPYDEIHQQRKCAPVFLKLFLTLIVLSICSQSFAAIWTFANL